MNQEAIYEIILSVLTHEATEKEHMLLKEWLEKSPENRDEYNQIVRLYKLSSKHKIEQTFDIESAWTKVRSKTLVKKGLFTYKIFIRYAAVLFVAIFSIGLLYVLKPQKDTLKVEAVVDIKSIKEPTLLLENGEQINLNDTSFVKYEENLFIKNEAGGKLIYESKQSIKKEKVANNQLIIPHGSTYQLMLSDGTQVWLNSESQFYYPSEFIGDKRIVTIKGEAYFKVSPNKEIPFIVRANGVDIEVLGTSFNVSCYNNENIVTTTLVEGAISVCTENGDTQTLTPSEQFSYDKTLKTFKLQEVDTEIYTAWTKGEYIFKDIPLITIIEKLKRWHDFSFEYEDETLMNKRYTLIANREFALDKLLEIISYTSDVELVRINNSINIKRKGEKSL